MSEDNTQSNGDRQMFDVDEKCSDCGTEIKKLPFKPNPDWTSNLKCLDCYKKSKA